MSQTSTRHNEFFRPYAPLAVSIREILERSYSRIRAAFSSFKPWPAV